MNVNDSATKPAKKKKKKVAPGAVEGRHLSSGTTIGGAPTGTAVGSEQEEVAAFSETTAAEPTNGSALMLEPVKPKKKKKQQPVEQPLTEDDTSTLKPLPNDKTLDQRAQPRTPSPLFAQEHLTVATDSNIQRRSSSASPTRSAHFGTHLLTPEGGKHEPPPRSVSPAKPALKHAGSPAGSSPSDSHSPNRFAGDISDSSAVSDDLRKSVARKKSVRVSFEATPEVVAIATAPALEEDEDEEEGMAPRPMLPSFGSIRGRKEPSQDVSPSNTRDSTANSSLSNSWAATMDTSMSSDHAIGGLLASSLKQDTSSSRDPLAPEVTSVEGTGYGTDSDASSSSDSEEEEVVEVPKTNGSSSIRQPGLLLESVPEGSETASLADEDVPTIAVQPATPATVEVKEQDEWLAVPGAFPAEFLDEAVKLEEATVTHHAEEESLTTQDDELRSQEVEAPVPATLPVPAATLQDLLPVEESEEDDSGDSIYSDAAEDISDGGFGSIDAIVESPSASPVVKSSPQSPVHAYKGTENFLRAQTQLQEALQKPPPVEAAPEPAAPKPKKKKKKAVNPKAIDQTEPKRQSILLPSSPLDSAFPKIKPAAPTNTSAMPRQAPGRQSMRASDPFEGDGPTLRMSMRGPGPAKSSLRNKTPSSAQRPTSVPPPAPPVGTLQKRNLRTSSATPASRPAAVAASAPKPMPSVAPMLKRNDSDSSSSFRRERRRPQSSNGRYTMARSMRGGPPEANPRPSTSAAAREVRSMSPVNRRPMTSGGMASGTMRMSMRGSTDNTPTMRAGRGKPASILSNSSKTKAAKPSRMSGFKSRIVDSSDEEDTGRGGRFLSSRYADSSDDEPEPLKLTPVRGIPRQKNGGGDDSTDLEDSSEDEGTVRRPAKAKVVKLADTIEEPEPTSPSSLRRKNSGSGIDLSKSVGTIPTFEETKKKGFFGRLRSKKQPSGIQKSRMESPARRDTHLERSPAELERNRVASGASIPNSYNTFPSPPGSPKSPKLGKLQRRSMPASASANKVPQVNPDDWPLPSPSPNSPNGLGLRAVGDIPRPNTSDGSVRRPQMGPRIFSNETNKTDGAYSARTGKKKRFPMLRRAFGLHD